MARTLPRPVAAMRSILEEDREARGATPWLEPTHAGEKARRVLEAMKLVTSPRYVPELPQQGAELAYRELIRSDKILRFEDLGAGSRASTEQVMKTRTISLGSFAKRSASRLWVRRLLYATIREIRPNRVLELGTAAGAGAASMACALSTLPTPVDELPRMVTVEGSSELASVAQELINGLGTHVSREILIVCVPFEPFYEDHLAEVGDQIGLAFIDGLHTPAFMNESLRAFMRSCRPGTVLFYDDLAWNGSTQHAWKGMMQAVRREGGIAFDLNTLGIIVLGGE